MKRAQKRNFLSLRLASRAAMLLLASLLGSGAGAATVSDSRVVTVEAGVHKLLRQPGLGPEQQPPPAPGQEQREQTLGGDRHRRAAG